MGSRPHAGYVLVYQMKNTAILLCGLLAACGNSETPTTSSSAVEVEKKPAVLQQVTQEAVAALSKEEKPVLAESVQDASTIVAVPVQEAIAQLAPEVPPPVPEEGAECRRVAAVLIERWEVSSPERYTRSLSRPIWPGGGSGVTWGIGYDGGQNTKSVILDDWKEHPNKDRLSLTSGLLGISAKNALANYRDIETSYEMASSVFEHRSLVQYKRQSDRVFRIGIADLNPNACGALVSLVYNRGGSMTGDSRREMRNIRDNCIPDQNYACIAKEIRSMCRLWKGTPNAKGLCARREQEARLAES